MISLKSLITEAKVPMISLQQAKDMNLFGPVYHGTSQDKLSKIGDEGFKVFVGIHGSSGISNGYQSGNYSHNAPPPIHHLGFGIYFTTVLAIAKKFSGGTARGLKVYYLKVPKLETINFGSPNTMMKWWIKNGYEPEVANRGELGRYKATVDMTNNLKSHWDAVWYKGKGIHRLLDGDQVCVFEPEGKIFEIDTKMAKGFEIGAKVVAKHRIAHLNYAGEEHRVIEAGDKGVILNRQEVEQSRKDYPLFWAKRAEKYIFEVKFRKSGRHWVEDVDVAPLSQ